MAFITKKNTTVPCYSCSKDCVNIEFCRTSSNDNASLGLSPEIYTFSRDIRVKIIANPDFWGFGTKATNVLISGWATYNESNYDFFDGYDKDHKEYRDCGISAGFFSDEQRPDVLFRSVYDPDTGTVIHHGASGEIEATGGTGRGGAEVYLIDRSGGLYYPISGDQPTCDSDPPHQAFRTFPENFGWGNKIHFNGDIFRNVSGGWRLTSIENCYGENIYKPSGYLVQCKETGLSELFKEKQNISYPDGLYENYEKTIKKGFASSLFPEYTTECRPDGSKAGNYKGRLTSSSSLVRYSGTSPLIQANLYYGPNLAASGLKNGMSIGIKTEVSGHLFSNVYVISDLQHQSNYTNLLLVGTSTGNFPYSNMNPDSNLIEYVPTGDFVLNDAQAEWTALNTYDPQTCCGVAAYGVSDNNKIITVPNNYHTDFRRIFNNPKNLRQSNMQQADRYTYGFFQSGIEPVTSGFRIDCSYPSVTGIELSGQIYGYPIIQDATGVSGLIAITGHSIITSTGEILFDNDLIKSGNPVFERQKSYYGLFLETDKFDTQKRLDTQRINRGKGRNGTCYSKQATLEIFPDCYTQYDKYEHCNYGETYAINKLPRLAFVYRGCDFNDECSFDDEGRPLGPWKDHNSEPEDMNDLKRLLAGQEIHMFINLNNAWGGRHNNQPCPCDCDNSEGGYRKPEHVEVRSPMRFPAFPNYDLYPVKYGCKDARHQISSIINLELLNTPEDSEYCDPLHTSENVCRVRQPYTTYGYMLNLCGKQTNDRRAVLESFNKKRNAKSYTNLNYTSDVVEPMYWSYTAPNPSPYNLDNSWSSGTFSVEGQLEDSSGVPFNQIGGYEYPFWGLADNYGNIVAPYFCTQRSTAICGCDGDPIATNLDYSVTGTYQNVLNTDTGWPTDAVPFLIELEVDEACSTNCVSPVMDESTNLVLEIDGLPGEFIKNQIGTFVDHYEYGHNYCKYGRTQQGVANFGKAKYDLAPTFNCTTGFNISTCAGSGADAEEVWASYSGNTCECANGFSTVLYPKVIPSSEIPLGWTSNPNGNAAGLVEITGCADLTSSYFSVGYDETVNGGYRIWAQFDLACGSLFPFLLPAEYPDAKYEGDPLSSIWGNGSCAHKYPAGNSDLTLQTTLWMIDVRHESTFRLLSSYALRRIAGMNLGNGILYPPAQMNFWGNQESNYFGLCPGDFVYTYGCKPENTYFYGEQDDDGRYPPNYEVCLSGTPCTTCDVGTGPGQVTCVCGRAAGYEGVIPHPMPIVKQINECDCLCETPHLLAKYQIDADSSGMTLADSYGNDVSIIPYYWMSYGGIDPILILQGPPAPYMGIRLKYGGGSEANWHDWSHGVNGLVDGITHTLYPPYKGRSHLLAGTECEQLSVDHQSVNSRAWVPTCEANTGCALDYANFSGTCGKPIYATGVYSGYPVRKKKCAPEIAMVTKIEKIGSNFKLYVSREYYEHDRTWYEQRVVGTGDEAEMTCVPLNQGAYEYNDGNTSGCYLMPYANFVDTVTPVSNWPCSIHPSSGVFINQDYQYSATGLTYDNQVFPSGSYTWNYYNLFYKNGFEPSVNYGQILDQTSFDDAEGTWSCTGVPFYLYQEISGKTILTASEYNSPSPGGLYGIFATTGTHSCIQDGPQCGGDMWCNKMFFPRHNYNAGTLIAPFGAGQICTGSKDRLLNNLGLGYAESYFSNEDNVPLLSTIPQAVDILEEMTERFVDFCTNGTTTQSLYDIGIDDDYLYVSDYLPLMGVVHPGWRYTTDMQSCTVAVSGKLPNISTHTNLSISAGLFAPKTYDLNKFNSMGYYLDSFGVSYSGYENGQHILRSANSDDNCLFNPFKILIDVECNTNRIRRKNVSTDSPTLLQGVQSWDARACLGIIQGVACGCGGTQCKYATKDREGSCIGFRVAEYEAFVSSDASGECYCGAGPRGDWYYDGLLTSADSITPTEPRCCIGCTECPGPGKWTADPCGTPGRIVRVGNPYSQVKMWQCDYNQYLHDHPNEFDIYPSGDCDCGGKYTEGLCGASWRCTDYTSCSCNPVSSGQQFVVNTPTSGNLSEWWADGDCHCDKSPQDDAAGSNHCRDSLIKWTATEQ